MPTWINTNGTVDTTTPLETGDKLLPQLQEFVGGYIEMITLNDGSAMLINEEGNFLHLPANPVATNIVKKVGWYFSLANGYLVGPVIHLTKEEKEAWEES